MKSTECAIQDVTYGTNIHIIKPVDTYRYEFRDNVSAGPFVEIQKDCVVGNGNRIQSHTFTRENVTLGENCFIGCNVTFASDLFRPGAPDPSPGNQISITLGDSVTVGNGAIILSPYICSGAVIGAGSIVVKPIEDKGIYAGNPAKLLRIL